MTFRDAPTGAESIDRIKARIAEAEEAGDGTAALRWKSAWTIKLMAEGGADGNVDWGAVDRIAEGIRSAVGTGEGEAK